MAVKTKKSKRFPHIEWIDLTGNDVYAECAVVKRDPRDNIYFIKLNELDAIDLERLFKIVRSRNATQLELWDLMHQVTLGNGINALEYFHQLVWIITSSGQVMRPQMGVAGGFASVVAG